MSLFYSLSSPSLSIFFLFFSNVKAVYSSIMNGCKDGMRQEDKENGKKIEKKETTNEGQEEKRMRFEKKIHMIRKKKMEKEKEDDKSLMKRMKSVKEDKEDKMMRMKKDEEKEENNGILKFSFPSLFSSISSPPLSSSSCVPLSTNSFSHNSCSLSLNIIIPQNMSSYSSSSLKCIQEKRMKSEEIKEEKREMNKKKIYFQNERASKEGRERMKKHLRKRKEKNELNENEREEPENGKKDYMNGRKVEQHSREEREGIKESKVEREMMVQANNDPLLPFCPLLTLSEQILDNKSDAIFESEEEREMEGREREESNSEDMERRERREYRKVEEEKRKVCNSSGGQHRVDSNKHAYSTGTTNQVKSEPFHPLCTLHRHPLNHFNTCTFPLRYSSKTNPLSKTNPSSRTELSSRAELSPLEMLQFPDFSSESNPLKCFSPQTKVMKNSFQVSSNKASFSQHRYSSSNKNNLVLSLVSKWSFMFLLILNLNQVQVKIFEMFFIHFHLSLSSHFLCLSLSLSLISILFPLSYS